MAAEARVVKQARRTTQRSSGVERPLSTQLTSIILLYIYTLGVSMCKLVKMGGRPNGHMGFNPTNSHLKFNVAPSDQNKRETCTKPVHK